MFLNPRLATLLHPLESNIKLKAIKLSLPSELGEVYKGPLSTAHRDQARQTPHLTMFLSLNSEPNVLVYKNYHPLGVSSAALGGMWGSGIVLCPYLAGSALSSFTSYASMAKYPRKAQSRGRRRERTPTKATPASNQIQLWGWSAGRGGLEKGLVVMGHA